MKKHILIIDQDQLILYGLAKALKDDGCEVRTAATISDAIEEFSHCPYDLCLLDIQLADLNGLDLIKAIHDICPETQVILMTADSFDSSDFSKDNPVAADHRALYSIPKPFALSDVTEVVNKVLAGAANETASAGCFIRGSEKTSRKHVRQFCNDEVCFGMSVIHEGADTRLSMKGQAVDISESGIGLLTSYPLRQSQVIGFDEKMDNRVGVVAWSRMIDRESFRVGVRFA